MLQSTQGALNETRDSAKKQKIQDFISLFQREEMDIAIQLSGLASQIWSQCPVNWTQHVRKGNSSQMETPAPWEPMPKALIVFDETLQ